MFSCVLNAQDLETILLAKDDAEKITEAYLKPAMKGLIYSMNNGWYHTAKVHKKFGIDLSIGLNASLIPEQDEIFSLLALELSSKSSTNQNTSPTIAGSEEMMAATITYTEQFEVQGQTFSSALDIELPTGIKESLPINAMPAPAVQLGIGLPFKMDAILRLVPKVGTDDVKGSLLGIGLKKEITNWFGPMKKTPLHIALLAAYTKMDVDYLIENQTTDNLSTNEASASFKLNAFTLQAITSLNFPFINFYGGIGYNKGNTELQMLGNYTLSYDAPIPSQTITNPMRLKTSASGINATIGTRLSLGFFKLFGSYTLQEYNTLNAGIAFSFG